MVVQEKNSHSAMPARQAAANTPASKGMSRSAVPVLQTGQGKVVQRLINITATPGFNADADLFLTAQQAFDMFKTLPALQIVHPVMLEAVLLEMDRANAKLDANLAVSYIQGRVKEFIWMRGPAAAYLYDTKNSCLVADVPPPEFVKAPDGKWLQFTSKNSYSIVPRNKLDATPDLDQHDNEAMKLRLSRPGKGDVVKALVTDPGGVDILKKTLTAQAQDGILQYNITRNTATDVQPGTDHDKVLQLVLQKVAGKYGSYTAEALQATGKQSVFAEKKDQVRLHQADSRWAHLKTNVGLVKEEAKLAAQYMTDTLSPISQTIENIQKKIHPTENLVSVEQSYLNALPYDDPALSLPLAEYRVRWAPLTIGSDIYIETPKSLKQFDTWTNYKYIVHEVIHTVAHPGFMNYLKDEAPVELYNTIIEGTTDYFAQQLWIDIINALQANVPNADIPVVQAIMRSTATKINSSGLAPLQHYRDTPLYQAQVPIIEACMKAFKNTEGDTRLKAAYFYGDVYSFFPRYK